MMRQRVGCVLVNTPRWKHCSRIFVSSATFKNYSTQTDSITQNKTSTDKVLLPPLPSNPLHEKYCREQTRLTDYEHYLLTALFSPSLQKYNFALRAFNTEVSAIKNNVQDVQNADLRIKWWRDAIRDCYKSRVPNHPVVQQLHHAIHDCKLTRGGLLGF
eukprot:TRINITY_DN1859_c0_g2_i7.p1 TRINITY_DN1859_c0_g2~~TRINITY_DN1859_c0_g2_i7.p1  ORF type:complete len:159 (-),score=9.54 TRINITY_DN1859_c0_g2_i7:339-815(-)